MPAAPANASRRRSLVQPVGDHQPHARPDRQLQLVVGLVAPVERDPRGRDPGAHARFDLAAARREQVEPLVRGQPEHRVRGERLHGVERLRERATRRDRSRATRSDRSNTSNGVPNRPASATALCPAIHMPSARNDALAGHGFGPATAETAAAGRRSRPTPFAQPSTRSMTSGADTPSSPSRFAMTCFVPEASQRRAWVERLVVGDDAALRVEAMELRRQILRRRASGDADRVAPRRSRAWPGTSASARKRSSSLSCVRSERSTSAIAFNATPWYSALRRMLAIRACPYCT